MKKKVLRYQGQDRCRCGGKLALCSWELTGGGMNLHVCQSCGQLYRERGQGK